MNYKIVAKYIKDLKFEIPNPKVFFSLEKDIVNYKINIDIKSNQFKNQIVEVETTLALNPINDNFERINTKIIFSTIIEIDGELSDKKSLEEIILIKGKGNSVSLSNSSIEEKTWLTFSVSTKTVLLYLSKLKIIF